MKNLESLNLIFVNLDTTAKYLKTLLCVKMEHTNMNQLLVINAQRAFTVPVDLNLFVPMERGQMQQDLVNVYLVQMETIVLIRKILLYVRMGRFHRAIDYRVLNAKLVTSALKANKLHARTVHTVIQRRCSSQLFVRSDTSVQVAITKKSVGRENTQRKVLVHAKIVNLGSSVRKQFKRNQIGVRKDTIVMIQAKKKPVHLVHWQLNII